MMREYKYHISIVSTGIATRTMLNINRGYEWSAYFNSHEIP